MACRELGTASGNQTCIQPRELCSAAGTRRAHTFVYEDCLNTRIVAQFDRFQITCGVFVDINPCVSEFE